MPVGAALGAAAASVAASAAGSLISGAMQGDNTSQASSQAQGISQATIDQADANRTIDRATFQPFVDQGTSATTQIGNILGLNGTDAAKTAMDGFTASPGYQYSVDQGLRAVDNGAAARGMLRSGATLKAEQTLGNNLANQDFGNYITRLNTLAGTGLQAASGQAGTTTTFNQLLNGQSTNQQQIIGQSATQQNSLIGNTASGITGAIKGTDWNSLFNKNGTAGAFDGAGAASVPAMSF